MSVNPFEQKIGRWLAAIPECWSYHPPDIPMRKQWAPADFLVMWGNRFVAIECKSVETGFTFPLSRWTPQQRQAAEGIRRAGGRYVLLVGFVEFDTARAYEPEPGVGRGSLARNLGRPIVKATLVEELSR